MKNKFLFLLLIVLHASVGLLAGALGWYNQLLVVTTAGAATIWIVFTRISSDWRLNLLAAFPFYAIYVPASIYVRSYQTFPIWITGIIVCCCAYVLLRYKKSWVLTFSVLLLLIAIGRFIVMPNNFAYLDGIPDTTQYKLTGVRMVDNKDREVSLSAFAGKVILLDIWHSSCGICIQKFPELQELYDDYKNDTNVVICSLNKPLPKDKGIKPEKWVGPYSFTSLYFADGKEADKLNVAAVPLVLIFDKSMKCRYAGILNKGWNIFIGNAKTIINRLKNEP